MTRLMEQAIARLQSVAEADQDRLAQFLINELDEDNRWAASTATHADALARHVESILADDAKGLCEPLNVDSL